MATEQIPVRGLDLEAFLDGERRRVDASLEDLLAEVLAGVPAGLAEPVRYAIAAGGKRLRPILCVAAWRAAGSRDAAPEAVYRLGGALELIHGYSLVHDDLPCMDDDDTRRGRPATHRAFGEPAAILAGAAMIPLACRTVAEAGTALGLAEGLRARLVAELCAAAGGAGMVGGQLLDLEGEGRRLELPELESIHRRKTGALLRAAPRMGALAAGAEEGVVAALTTYGEHLGLAFQIADDVLDVTAEAATLGKPAGSDTALGKATYPALLGVEGARDRALAESRAATHALRAGGVDAAPLEALARFAVEREW